jgi:DNA repair exonuclease SbcCD ATPase subunit
MIGRKQTLETDLFNKEKTKKELAENVIYLEECRLITQLISESNQQKLTTRINDVVTTAIQEVFGEEFEFKLEIAPKNNSIIASPTFYKNGQKENPKASEGGGMLSVASLALRVVFMTLLKNPAKIMILDEPYAGLGSEGGGLARGCQLISTISEKLGVQFVIITHGEAIKTISDRVFYVSMKEEENSKITVKDNIKEITQEDI